VVSKDHDISVNLWCTRIYLCKPRQPNLDTDLLLTFAFASFLSHIIVSLSAQLGDDQGEKEQCSPPRRA